jgi:hypothetical protein
MRSVRLVGVVESDPFVDLAFGWEAVLQFVLIDGLLFERSTRPFDDDDDDIVQISALAIHEYFDIGFSQGRGPSRTCK